ncbi:MAG: 8-oxo-dGTP diphosphatase [Firmicutes bacterium]|nr:8-oxo-dGTP diphosphatase [Bacillota bacterium]
MLITTLCYIEHKNHYLMLHRTKKAHDINEGKWIGVGGKFTDRESPEECLVREVFEETGYSLKSWRFRGFITFLQENYETEYMCLYTADLPDAADPAFASDDASRWPVPDCNEGELAWIPKDRVGHLNLWPGDRIFLRLLLEREEFFSLKLLYSGDDLLEAVLF